MTKIDPELRRLYDGMRQGSIAIFFLAGLAQLTFFSSFENFICVGLALSVLITVVWVFLTPSMIFTFPLSSIPILACGVANFGIPLVVTLLERHSITYNLVLPVRTFGCEAIFVLTLVAAHFCYRRLSSMLSFRNWFSERVLARLGVFKVPSEFELWFLGIIGSLALFYNYLFLPDVGLVAEGARDKFVQAIHFFAFTPYLLVMPTLYGSRKPVARRTVIFLILYSVVILWLACGRNSRGAFSMPFAIMGLCFVLSVLLGKVKWRIVSPKTFFWGGLIFFLLATVVADLTTALQIVRHYRGSVASGDLVSRSWEVFQDKEAIRQERMKSTDMAAQRKGWDESYISNPSLARLVHVKYTDNALVLAAKMGSAEKTAVAMKLGQRFWAVFPKPVLNMLFVNVSKEEVTAHSMGDYMYYLVTGTGLGGRRIGSAVVDGMVVFGPFFFPLVGAVSMGIFLLFDALSLLGRSSRNEFAERPSEIIISVVALLNIYSITLFFNSDSSVNFVAFFVRGFPQMVFLYVMLFHAARMCSFFFRKRQGYV